MSHSITEYKPDFYILDEGRVRQFLFVGGTEAVLVDTGFPDSGVAACVRELTDKPIKVILTHADMDHAGGLKDFSECRVHEKDSHMIQAPVTLNTLTEGDRIEVGDYHFEVLSIPGHTYGSIALWERSQKLLFPGDSVQKGGPIFMFGAERNLDCYLESLRRLSALQNEVTDIFPCHNACPIEPEYIDYCLEDALAYRDGKLSGEKHPFMPCSTYHGKHVDFLF